DLGDLRGKRVLVRSDFNVPLDGSRITDDGRIRAALPTLQRLVEAGAKVIVTAHLGRPKGTVDPAFSLAPVAHRLGELLGTPVTLPEDSLCDGVCLAAPELQDVQLLVLETIRFDTRETCMNETERSALAQDHAVLSDV